MFWSANAHEILKSLALLNYNDRVKASQTKWTEEVVHAVGFSSKNGFTLLSSVYSEDLQQVIKGLIALRRASLDRHSVMMSSQTAIRVYQHQNQNNLSQDKWDIFGRGIDFILATAVLLSFSDPLLHSNSLTTNLLLQEFQKFYFNIKEIPENKIEQALKIMAQFNGELARLLQSLGGVEKRLAEKMINFSRDVIWCSEFRTKMISLTQKHQNQQAFYLRYFEPISFSLGANQSSPWSLIPEAIWRKDFLNQAIMVKFLNHYQSILKEISLTPMNRYTPNPANAYWCVDAIIAKVDHQILHETRDIRTAITDPFDIKDEKARLKITLLNHQALFDETLLERGMSHQNGFLDTSLFQVHSVPIPIVHQTLVANLVRFTPDDFKSSSLLGTHNVIYAKHQANLSLKPGIEHLKLKNQFGDKKRNPLKLFETNHCVNMWHARSRIHATDMRTPEKLIAIVIQYLQCFPKNKRDISTISAFLSDNTRSMFFSYGEYQKDVKSAMKSLLGRLMDEAPLLGMTRAQRTQFALMVASAVELKVALAESKIEKFWRETSEWSRITLYPLPFFGLVIDFFFRLLLSCLMLILSPILLSVNFREIIVHRHDRASVYRALYEGLLAQSLGLLVGGCMSSLDRATELADFRAALKWQLFSEGKILSMNDSSSDKKAFFEKYGQTQTKHDFVEMATGTAATIDIETRGLNPGIHLMSSQVETSLEQNMARTLYPLRKGFYTYSKGNETIAFQAQVKMKAEKGWS